MNDDAIRALAAEILRRDEYAGTRRALAAWDSLREWLAWLEALLGWGELRDTNPALFYAILAALLVVAAALVAHIAWTVRAALVFPAARPPAAAGEPRARFAEDAEELARAGRFLEAARLLQLAVLEILLRGRVVELARSEPNRVLRRRLAAAPLADAERRDLVALLDRYERRWFRDREEDAGLFEGWRALHRRLVAAA